MYNEKEPRIEQHVIGRGVLQPGNPIKDITELDTILNRFNEANARLDNLSLEIKNKVGQISTIMEEKSQDATNPKQPDVSITDRLHSALSSMSYYNDRLNTVLNHLNRVV